MKLTCFVDVSDSFAMGHEWEVLAELSARHWRSPMLSGK
jgi:hypothetical protein